MERTRISTGYPLLHAAVSESRLMRVSANKYFRYSANRKRAVSMFDHQGSVFTFSDITGKAVSVTSGSWCSSSAMAREHNFNSIIVVTSNWHMPRAMAELEHQLPEVTLTAFPVMSEKVKTEPWWSNIETARFLFAEYLKYLFALTRMSLDSDTAA